MTTLRSLVGLVLFAIALVVAAHTVLEPLFHTSTEANPFSPLWGTIDALMAAAVVLGVIFSYLHKRGAAGEAAVAANILFYGFLFVGILFFRNWFDYLRPAYDAPPAAVVGLTWVFIDAALPLLSGVLGLYLLRKRM